ncbi:MAG TPA: hypothetical protein PKE12_06280 [Kiritimatiellia bacterium]|nr:hypothetical protein [Kiritimatiellia bacterium]
MSDRAHNPMNWQPVRHAQLRYLERLCAAWADGAPPPPLERRISERATSSALESAPLVAADRSVSGSGR